MKATGIVRPIDALGRVVIPKELRKVFQIKNKDAMEIFVDDDMIILKKYEPACVFCGETDNLITYEDRTICSSCVDRMKELVSKSGK